MFRNSLGGQPRAQVSNTGPEIPDGDEYYEFDGAKLEIKHNDTIRESSGVSIRGKISSTGEQSTSYRFQHQSSILEGSDSIQSPESKSPEKESRMAEQTNAEINNVAQVPTNTTENEVIPASIVKPKVGSPRHFFCFRQGLFDQAVVDCTRLLLQPNNDLQVVGSYLLTTISHWDHERERMIILTKKSLWVVKYDFIAMRIIEQERHLLNKIDTIQVGPLTYPSSSIVPKLEGLSNGVGGLFTGEIFKRKDKESPPSGTSSQNQSDGGIKNIFECISTRVDLQQFHAQNRNEHAIRLKWNKGQPLSAASSWNPFADIPWKTITSHPLGTYVDIYNSEKTIQDGLEKNKDIYLVENLYNSLLSIFREPNPTIDNNDINYDCKIEEAPVVQENYVNVPAMVHNKNNFGFFKVRGKFSF